MSPEQGGDEPRSSQTLKTSSALIIGPEVHQKYPKCVHEFDIT